MGFNRERWGGAPSLQRLWERGAAGCTETDDSAAPYYRKRAAA